MTIFCFPRNRLRLIVNAWQHLVLDDGIHSHVLAYCHAYIWICCSELVKSDPSITTCDSLVKSGRFERNHITLPLAYLSSTLIRNQKVLEFCV